MALKVYVNPLSEPSRAVLLFCKITGIDFEEIHVDIAKNQQFSPEFMAINPLHQIPAIVDRDFKLSESHAILIYISSAFPGVASHWYPADIFKRAKIHSVLDWHLSNICRGQAGLEFNTVIAPLCGMRNNPELAIEAEKKIVRYLSKLENVWLKDGQFLFGNSEPSIADISIACQVMQLEVLSEKDHSRILGPNEKVIKWIKDVRIVTAPFFDEVHEVLYDTKKKVREQMATQSKNNELN